MIIDKKYLNKDFLNFSLKNLISYLFFSLSVYFYNYSFIFRIITCSLSIILFLFILSTLTLPQKFLNKIKKDIKKENNPLKKVFSKLINILFIILLTLTNSWILLSLFIISMLINTLILSK